MYKEILVPLDGSKRAEVILPHVEEMAKRYDAGVIFLFVDELRVMLGWDEVVDLSKCRENFEGRKRKAESYLAEQKKEFHAKGIKVDAHVVHGPVVKSILAAAEEMNADIIAMASHGFGGLPRTFYGSVSAGVLQSVDRPLLLIRSRKIE